MALLDELIELYASLRTDDVANSPAYVALFRKESAQPFFNSYRHRVEEQKRRLESILEIQETAQKQVKFALQRFQQSIDPFDINDITPEICLRLIRRAYYSAWTTKQKTYFDGTVEYLKRRYHYFLSFTQRRPGGTNNPMNSEHRFLIESYGIRNPQEEKDNQLARMLHALLKSSEFRGFYYPEYEGDQADIPKRLEEAMDHSLIFVQLVQNEMFSKLYPLHPNYCSDEYAQAARLQKKMICLFANGKHPKDFIATYNIYPDLEPWHQFIFRSECPDLDPTLTLSDVVRANREKLKKGLVEKMKRFREELWENVPGDLE